MIIFHILECVCVFLLQTGAHFSAPSLVTRGDLCRVTWAPVEKGRRASRCLWKSRAPIPSAPGIPESALGLSAAGGGKEAEFPFSVLPAARFLSYLTSSHLREIDYKR